MSRDAHFEDQPEEGSAYLQPALQVNKAKILIDALATIALTGEGIHQEIAKKAIEDYAAADDDKAQEEAVDFLKWVANYKCPGTEYYLSDGITLVDGHWYWNNDRDGDQPLSEEQLYNWYKSSPPDAGKEQEAVAFYEWVLKNEWELTTREQKYFTTKELYTLYKQNK